jgi:hypothetical protein
MQRIRFNMKIVDNRILESLPFDPFLHQAH